MSKKNTNEQTRKTLKSDTDVDRLSQLPLSKLRARLILETEAHGARSPEATALEIAIERVKAVVAEKKAVEKVEQDKSNLKEAEQFIQSLPFKVGQAYLKFQFEGNLGWVLVHGNFKDALVAPHDDCRNYREIILRFEVAGELVSDETRRFNDLGWYDNVNDAFIAAIRGSRYSYGKATEHQLIEMFLTLCESSIAAASEDN